MGAKSGQLYQILSGSVSTSGGITLTDDLKIGDMNGLDAARATKSVTPDETMSQAPDAVLSVASVARQMSTEMADIE